MTRTKTDLSRHLAAVAFAVSFLFVLMMTVTAPAQTPEFRIAASGEAWKR